MDALLIAIGFVVWIAALFLSLYKLAWLFKNRKDYPTKLFILNLCVVLTIPLMMSGSSVLGYFKITWLGWGLMGTGFGTMLIAGWLDRNTRQINPEKK